MEGYLERFFKLKENNTSIRTEMVGGVTTFMTMSYIIFLQPAVLSLTGMDSGAVMVATCISSALATLLMGLLALALMLGQWHYLGDIFAGTLVGCAAGAATMAIWRLARARRAGLQTRRQSGL